MPAIQFKIAPNDQDSIHIAVEVDGTEVARAQLHGTELDYLIRALGQHRAGILPVQPAAPDMASMPVLNVQAYGFADQKVEGAAELLAVSHPMFGWLGLIFPEGAGAEVGARLLAQGGDDKGSPKGKKAN
jgi:hypothetical protein